jgi:hypothetical protein
MKRSRSSTLVEERVVTLLRDNHSCMARDALQQALPGVAVDAVVNGLVAAGTVVLAAEGATLVLVPEHVAERMLLMTAERSERHLKLLLLDIAAQGNAGVTKKQLKRSRLATNLIEDGLKKLSEEKLIKSTKRPHEKELVYLPFWISLAAQAAGDVWYSTGRKGYHHQLVDLMLGLLCQSCSVAADVVPLDVILRDFLGKAQKAYAAMMKDEPQPLQELSSTHVEGLLSLLVSEGSLMQLSDGFCLLERGKARIELGKKLAGQNKKTKQEPNEMEHAARQGLSALPCGSCPERFASESGECAAMKEWIAANK